MIKKVEVIEMFKKAIEKNRLSHLYLLSGLKGSGKKTLAYNVASVLLNTDFLELKEKGHINLFYLEPSGYTLKTSQIEELQQEFYKTSLVDGYRVYIIDEIEKLTLKAANQLLKFLEEPVSKVSVGFLLTQNKEKVIDTILSRSQVINLAAPLEKDLKEKLLKVGVSLEMAELFPYLDKNIDNLLKMKDNPGFQTLIACFNDYLKALINEENMWLFAQDNLLEIKYDKQLLGYFLQLLLVFYLDLYYYKDNKESQITAFYQYYQAYQINFLEIKTQLKNIQELIKMLNYNVNIDLAFNNYILDL